MSQGDDQFAVAVVRHSDDPEGGLHEQSVVHRPPDNVLHARSSADGSRAPHSDDAGSRQRCQRAADPQPGSGEEPRRSDDARHAQDVHRQRAGRTYRQDAGRQGHEGHYEDGRRLG